MQGAPLGRDDGVDGLLVGHILAAEQFSQRVGRADYVTPTRGHLADEGLECANNGHRHPGHVGAQPGHVLQEHPAIAGLPADAARRLVQADELPQVAQLDTVLLADLVEICLVTACSTPARSATSRRCR